MSVNEPEEKLYCLPGLRRELRGIWEGPYMGEPLCSLYFGIG